MIVKVRASKYKAPRFLASLWWVLTTWQCGSGQSGCCTSVLSWPPLSQRVKLHPLSIPSCTGAPKFLRNQQSSEYLAPKLALIGTWDLEKACCHVPSHGMGTQPLWRNPTLWSSPFLAPVQQAFLWRMQREQGPMESCSLFCLWFQSTSTRCDWVCWSSPVSSCSISNTSGGIQLLLRLCELELHPLLWDRCMPLTVTRKTLDFNTIPWRNRGTTHITKVFL